MGTARHAYKSWLFFQTRSQELSVWALLPHSEPSGPPGKLHGPERYIGSFLLFVAARFPMVDGSRNGHVKAFDRVPRSLL